MSFCVYLACVWIRVCNPSDHHTEHLDQVHPPHHRSHQRRALGEQGCLHALSRAFHRIYQGKNDNNKHPNRSTCFFKLD